MAHFVMLHFPTWDNPEERDMGLNMDKVLTIKPSGDNSILLLDLVNPDKGTRFFIVQGTPLEIVKKTYETVRDCVSHRYAEEYIRDLLKRTGPKGIRVDDVINSCKNGQGDEE